MKCLICNEETIYIDHKHFSKYHLKKYHDVTSKEYYDQFLRIDGDGICSVCNKETTFMGMGNGYKKWHRNCSMKSKEHVDKVKLTWRNKSKEEIDERTNRTKNTKLKRYGDPNYRNQEKIEETNLKRYGSVNPLCNDRVKEKKDKKVLEVYGIKNISQNRVIKEKKKQSCLENNGVEYGSQIDIVRENHKKRFLEMFKVKIDKILHDTGKTFINKNEDNMIICHCDKCNSNFEIYYYTLVFRNGKGQDLCVNCKPLNSFENSTSSDEQLLCKFIEDNYSGKIIKNDRNLIKPLEVDIYLPEINLAIEYNGAYWHSIEHKPKYYHLNKTKKCLKYGVQLIHIYERVWKRKENIIKSKLLEKLNLYETIDINDCVIKADIKCYDFLNENSIDGFCEYDHNMGIFHGADLVSVMTLKNIGGGSFEILRYVNKLGVVVKDGIKGFMDHFIKYNKVNSMIVKVTRTWDIGEMYKNSGFDFIGNSGPNCIRDGYEYYDSGYSGYKKVF